MTKQSRLWVYQIPTVLVFVAIYGIMVAGEKGLLHSAFLRDSLFPSLRRVAGQFTDFKFRARGTQAPKSKIVIVSIDSESIEAVGRWPWHRDYMAYLIDRTFQSGAKAVGLDIVFSEADQRIPDPLAEVLNKSKLGHLIKEFETDPTLAQVIGKYKDRLVLGWTTDSICQPAYQTSEECPVTHPDSLANHPEGFDRFAFSKVQTPPHFDPTKTPLLSLISFIANIPSFNSAASHAGTFNAFPDSDGFIRRTPLVVLANGKPYPSLALELARVALNDDLSIRINSDHQVDDLRFQKSNRAIAVNPIGSMEINFRGPSYTYPYVSALEVMGDADELHVGFNRGLATTRNDLLKDAIVLIGLSAVGVYDMRAFPYDSNTPGVEGHATILDNLLADDYLRSNTQNAGFLWIVFLMTVGALFFAWAIERLESISALLLFVGCMGLLGFIDVQLLFKNLQNWNTAFLCIELLFIFVVTIALKYVIEEKSKKFLKSAFSKYVAPAVVDSLVKNPDKLSLGGEKKELTILFSDIRGFTTLSEKMDPKMLSKFLNEYLGEMTKIIFGTKGTLDKYIGDAVMAFWGAPIDFPEHGANACAAAVQMQLALAKEKPKFLREYGIEVEVGIGLNSGMVSVGNMGSKDNFNYTVLGDDVNLASRLEGLTKYYRSSIVTTRQTLDQIKRAGLPAPDTRTLDFVKVKGKKQAVEIIQVLEAPLKDHGHKQFLEARNLYQNQKWDDAIKLFSETSRALEAIPGKGDGPCEMYVERCDYFKQNPPGKEWDGTWEMTSK